MKTLFIKIIFLYVFLLINFSQAQHEHNGNTDNPMKQIFSTQQSEFSAEVLSAPEKLITKKQVILYLKLSSISLIDSSPVTLRINSHGNVHSINKLMDYSSGLYNSTVQFQESGSHQFSFSFNLKDSTGNLKKANFSFTKDVVDADNMNNHEHGFMGMSNAMMIIMGAGMVAMMVIAIIAGTNHK